MKLKRLMFSQMSTLEKVKIAIKDLNTTTTTEMPYLGMRSNVFLLCSLLRRKRAKAKLNQMQTKLSFFSGGVKAVSTT